MATEFTDSMELGVARAKLREKVWEGATCPLCRQTAKAYRRSIHAGIVVAAIRLYRATTPGEFGHLPTVEKPQRGGEGAKLRYWKLAVEEAERREDGGRSGWWCLTPDGGRSGWWCLTPDGRAFVEGSHRVQRYAWVYDGRLLRREGELVSIADCLGDKFSYAELMNGGRS
ncbi:MAG TPA: hypothetical protein VL979_02075 [Solirubrobacteraceae bacterium]|nr:hypothetical protein [Solirubrobacteraceae bacterium]